MRGPDVCRPGTLTCGVLAFEQWEDASIRPCIRWYALHLRSAPSCLLATHLPLSSHLLRIPWTLSPPSSAHCISVAPQPVAASAAAAPCSYAQAALRSSLEAATLARLIHIARRLLLSQLRPDQPQEWEAPHLVPPSLHPLRQRQQQQQQQGGQQQGGQPKGPKPWAKRSWKEQHGPNKGSKGQVQGWAAGTGYGGAIT